MSIRSEWSSGVKVLVIDVTLPEYEKITQCALNAIIPICVYDGIRDVLRPRLGAVIDSELAWHRPLRLQIVPSQEIEKP